MERMLYSAVAVNKNIEAIQTPPSIPRPIYKWGIVALIATIVSHWWLLHHVDAEVALRAVVALAPIPIWFMAMRSGAQRIRLVDEMQRIIFYKAWVFAGRGTMFVMIALWQVELIGLHLPDWLSHGLDYQCTILLMVSLVFVGYNWINRRYK
jgi:hypothetical protein